jgi:hypothetical protein
MMLSAARCATVLGLLVAACASPPPPERKVGTPDNVDVDALVWRKANLTNFESYPDPGSEECIEFNGCTWAGHFAGRNGKQSKEWVMATNIAAVHSDDFDEYRERTLRLRHEGREIDVIVYDTCSDSDCDGCCTRNAAATGFLIDLEVHTADRFNYHHGEVEWACLDCD